MSVKCTGIILAGGENSRFGGDDKAFFRLSGRRLISPIIELFSSLFEDVIVVAANPRLYLEWDLTVVSDVLPIRSSLTGIYTGMFYASTPYIFVSACDTPFIRKELVELIVSEIRPGLAAVMPETGAGVEPLFAAYSKACLPMVENAVKNRKFKIRRVFRKKRVKLVSEKKVLAADPELLSFFNINTPEDLDRAAVLAGDQMKGCLHG